MLSYFSIYYITTDTVNKEVIGLCKVPEIVKFPLLIVSPVIFKEVKVPTEIKEELIKLLGNVVSFLVRLFPTDTDNKLVNGDCKVPEMVKLFLNNPFPEIDKSPPIFKVEITPKLVKEDDKTTW